MPRTNLFMGTVRCCAVIYGLTWTVRFFFTTGWERAIMASLALLHLLALIADFSLVLRWKLKPIMDNPTIEDRDHLLALNILTTLLFYFGGLRKDDLQKEYEQEVRFLSEASGLIETARGYSPELENRVIRLVRKRDLALALSAIKDELGKRARALTAEESILKRAEQFDCTANVMSLIQEGRHDDALQYLSRAQSLLQNAESLGIKERIASLVTQGEFDKAQGRINQTRRAKERDELLSGLTRRIELARPERRPKLEKLLQEVARTEYTSRAYRKARYELDKALEQSEGRPN